jgi:hypothetical protein
MATSRLAGFWLRSKMPGKHGTPEERFWRHIDKRGQDECWEWQSAKNKDGYGRFIFDKKNKSVHRISWEISNGAIPDGRCVLHTCDVRSCVNPKHLHLGTKHDNSQDMVSRGRSTTNNFRWKPKLNLQIANDIREKYSMQMFSPYKLAEEYSVSRTTIYQVIHNEIWVSYQKEN